MWLEHGQGLLVVCFSITIIFILKMVAVMQPCIICPLVQRRGQRVAPEHL